MFWQNLESDDHAHVALPEAEMNRHVTVLRNEVLQFLHCRSDQSYLDLTLGGGGHTEAILQATGPAGVVVGVDRDPVAIDIAKARLASFGGRFQPIHSSLGKIDEVLKQTASLTFAGAVMDLGLSSNQLEDGARGFSFQKEGPLDMRMDPTSGVSAYEWLSSATEKEIADTLYIYGQERHSRRIAKALVAARRINKLKTTKDLAEIVRSAVPAGARYGRIHPATRTFQAVRILVNDELNQIRHAISRLLELLPHQSRIVVISFHSLEDQIAKILFREAEREGRGNILTKKPLTATEEELRSNPRSRSAKLRAFEKLGAVA